jgi:hypothetical protein
MRSDEPTERFGPELRDVTYELLDEATEDSIGLRTHRTRWRSGLDD